MALLERTSLQPFEYYAPVDKPTGVPEQGSAGMGLEGELEGTWANLGRTFRVFDPKGVRWREDLTENAQWAFGILLVASEELEVLHHEALQDGRDLQAAIDEIESHGIQLDRNEPGWIGLPYETVPAKKRVEK